MPTAPSERKNLLALRVEADPALLHPRDVGEVRRLRGAVADEHVAVRLLAALHAIEEVVDVVLVEAALGLHHRGLRISALRREREAAAGDRHAPFGPHDL